MITTPIADGVVDLPSDHALPGNPMRLRSGAIRIEGDDRWRTGLSARDAAVVQVLTRPLAARFGYGTPSRCDNSLVMPSTKSRRGWA